MNHHNAVFSVCSQSVILLILFFVASCQSQKKSHPGNQRTQIFPGKIDTTSQLPPGFKQTLIASGLHSPSSMIFSPDGRLLIGERIQGDIRVLMPNGKLLPDPMLQLDIPKDDNGQPVNNYSSGIRSFIYDPHYPEKPFLYVFYMKDTPRQNRVSRFRISRQNPNRVVEGSEKVLIDLPFNEEGSAGSNNGGALIFGEDGKLYIATGDGLPAHGSWKGGDPVQSLKTYTGKIFRINKDGTIPENNPFYNRTEGKYRAIYALGLRNPFSMSKQLVTQNIYINDVSMAGGYKNKDHVYKLKAGANYMWEWDSKSPGKSLGTPREPVALAGPKVITGGDWYPQNGYFPQEYRGNYFITIWGAGKIVRMISEKDTKIKTFLTFTGGDMGEPAYIQVGPHGNLYWLATTYQTDNGSIFKISYSKDSIRN